METALDYLSDQSTTEGPKVAHYAEAVSVTEGYVMGRPVMSVCGILFIPSRDPLKFPVCQDCQKIVDALYLSNS